MPFGAIFAVLVFGVVSPWLGVRLFGAASLPGRVSGASLVALGLALVLGLLLKRSWARWAGVVGSFWTGLAALGLVLREDSVLGLLALFAALATAVLLIVPATGRFVRDEAAVPQRARVWTSRVLAAITVLAIVGLTGANFMPRSVSRNAAEPRRAANASTKVDWLDFAPGQEKARAAGRLMLVDFYADWCGPCKQMDRTTFRDARVVAKLGEVVPVRVDSEEESPRHGLTGFELAERYDVSSYPTVMLIDGDGRIVARASGYRGPKQFLVWLDEHVPRDGRPAA